MLHSEPDSNMQLSS